MTTQSTASLLERTAHMAIDYLRSVRERPAFPPQAAIEGLAEFEQATPERPTDANDVLGMLNAIGSPATVASTGGRYFGFVVGGALPAAVAANWLATAWDQNAGLELLSPVASRLERVCEQWVLDLLRLPSNAAVGFVSGASEASFTAMAAARHLLLKRAGWDVAEHGLNDAPPIRVVISEQAHASLHKALALLGIGRRSREVAPVDSQGRVKVDALPDFDDRTLVIIQAGHVDTGSFDPFREVCDRANEAGAWVHVDGAFGLWAATSSQYRHLLDGCDRADSWAVDAHKYLNVPYDSGLIVCRNASVLVESMNIDAPYILFSSGRDGSRFTAALSRRSRVIDLWAAIKALGRSGIAEIVERTCSHARRLADGLRRAGFDILNEVVLNQVLVATASDAETTEITRLLQVSGECWCGTTIWRGSSAIRLSVCSWATTTEDIDRTIDAFRAAKRAATGRPCNNTAGVHPAGG